MSDISREDALAHFGVKGMRWGVRNDKSSNSSTEPKKRVSKKKKAAIGVGVLAVGAATAAVILKKQGKLPIQQSSTTKSGAKAAKQMSDTDTFKKLLKSFDADIADAHKEQTTWMRDNLPSYNPRDNPFVPKSEIKRLNNR